MPFLSLIVPTMRVGGLDILFDSLAKQTFTDFELVLVDGLFQHRAEMVAEKARDRFLRVVHVEPQPNPFPGVAFCKYANAGLARATGEVAVFMVDYTRLPPDTLARHATFHREDETRRAGLMMPHRYVGLDVSPDFPRYGRGDVDAYQRDVESRGLAAFMWSIGKALDTPAPPHQVDGGGFAPPDADPKLRMPASFIDAGFFHAKNESVRLEHALAINGWDEDLDDAHVYQDSDFADRLSVKAGVRWQLDPTHAVEIANPRHVFPFARRTRPHEDNWKIWQGKKAAGYPSTLQLAGPKPLKTPQPLKVAMIYGEFSSAIHGPFDLEGLYTRVGLTGSESSFFNLARTLAENGNQVVAFCDCVAPFEHPSGLVIVPMSMIRGLPQMELDAVIAWNEPDYLQFAPPGVKRYVDQQLNDFGYCRYPKWRELVDVWVSPSRHHLDHLIKTEGVPADRSHVIPNSVDLDLFDGPDAKRNPMRVVWCSSPDRGLHHLLSMWPLIRAKAPGAELRVFYRLAPWLDRVRGMDDEVGRRARYIEEAISRLDGHGVTVVGPVPNAQMARELQEAAVLAYPCDPVRYTEGFGCSVLDAAAGGCVPVFSDADALPSVHKRAGFVIRGNPADPKVREAWTDVVASILTLEGGAPKDWRDKMADHALDHSRGTVSDAWEALLRA